MRKYTLEICTDSVESAIKAEKTDKDAKIPVHGDEQCENM